MHGVSVGFFSDAYLEIPCRTIVDWNSWWILITLVRFNESIQWFTVAKEFHSCRSLSVVYFFLQFFSIENQLTHTHTYTIQLNHWACTILWFFFLSRANINLNLHRKHFCSFSYVNAFEKRWKKKKTMKKKNDYNEIKRKHLFHLLSETIQLLYFLNTFFNWNFSLHIFFLFNFSANSSRMCIAFQGDWIDVWSTFHFNSPNAWFDRRKKRNRLFVFSLFLPFASIFQINYSFIWSKRNESTLTTWIHVAMIIHAEAPAAIAIYLQFEEKEWFIIKIDVVFFSHSFWKSMEHKAPCLLLIS